MMKRPLFLLAPMMVLLASSAYASVNLLTNPGFETGDFTGWTVSANTVAYGVGTDGQLIPISDTFPVLGQMQVSVNSGTYAAWAVTCNPAFTPGATCSPSGDAADSLTLSQTVNLVAGTTYDIGYWTNSYPFGDSSAIDVNGTPISLTTVPSAPGYQFEGGLFTAAATGPADVSFFLEYSGLADAGISFDDFQVANATPEPSLFVVLGVGLLGLGASLSRRRKAVRS